MTTSANNNGSNNTSDINLAISLNQTLISLPSCDLKSIGSGLEDLSKCHDDPLLPPLLLMQLPANDIQQLLSCKSYFLGQSNEESNSCSGSSSRACLVMEASSTAEGGVQLEEAYSIGKTFLLNRVETSNSLILIPSSTKNANTSYHNSQEHIDKKMKEENRNEQLVVGRLVNPSSFLELKRKPLNMQQLYDLLYQDCISRQKKKNSRSSDFLKRRNDNNSNGYTIAALASLLQSSAAEVKGGLAELCAFEIHNQEEDKGPNSTRYTFLSDETIQEYMRLIFAVFIEYPELMVTSEGIQTITIHKRDCCTQVLTLVEQQDGDESLTCDEFDIADIIQYCLHLIGTSPTTNNSVDHPSMTIDKDKVAIHLAHDIFQQKQPSVENNATRRRRGRTSTAAPQPFIEGTDRKNYCWTLQKFQEEWCRQMPFSTMEGKDPSIELLKGIAVKERNGSTVSTTTTNDNTHEDPTTIVLSYFPERTLPLDTEQRLRKIFTFREEWTLKDLEPYIHRLVCEGSRTQAELLLKYTRVITKDDGTIVYRIRK